MDRYTKLMQDLAKTQSKLEDIKIDSILKKSQYTQARKSLETPTLRMSYKEGQSYANDNFPNGYVIDGWDALEETPQDILHKLLNPVK